MKKSTFAEVRVTFMCSGCTPDGSAALEEPVEAKAALHMSPGSAMIYGNVECGHNTGGHGQRCRASHPGTEKAGKGVLCPFAFDYPYVLERDPDWKPPEELKQALGALRILRS